jgi:hypothetical protein
LKTTATLTLEFSDARSRRSLAEVLAPDNRELPRGLSLNGGGGPKSIQLTMESESPSTSLSTALAFLRDIALFQEVWLLSHDKDGRVGRTDSH